MILFAILTCLTALPLATPSPRLVPSKRAISLEQRSSWKRDIAARHTVDLHYGPSSYHPPSTVVSLSAPKHRPLLLLEHFDHLLFSAVCTDDAPLWSPGSTITLEFIDDFAFAEAEAQWTALDEFVLITAHPGCNPPDERGSWVVDSVVEDFAKLRLTLLVEPISMRSIFTSLNVAYSGAGAKTWTGEELVAFVPRAEHDEDALKSFSFDPDIPARMALFPPPNSSLAGDIAGDIISQLTDADLELTCVGCVLKMNFTIGLDLDVTVNDDCLDSSDSCLVFNNIGMNFTVEDFEQVVDMEVYLSKPVSKYFSYKIKYVPIEDAAVEVPGVLED